nr:pyridoxal 5'-phosphate synthase glutaminase subunit PdxT [Clostridioides sp.]
MKIGVLAMQGAFHEHIAILKKLNVETIVIRNKEHLKDINGIILPGGESTAIGKLIVDTDIKDMLKDLVISEIPVWGTCAGMILLANKISGEDYTHLSTMDIEVVRNAYGKQLGSFRTKSKVKNLGDDIDMVFIRAPYIKSIGKNVEILSVVDENIVSAREKNMLVTSFHPELTNDLRFHKYFVNMVDKNNRSIVNNRLIVNNI